MKRKHQPDQAVWVTDHAVITAGPDYIQIDPAGPGPARIPPLGVLAVIRALGHAALWQVDRHDPKPDAWATCRCGHSAMQHWRRHKSRLGRCHGDDCECLGLVIPEPPEVPF